MAPVPKRRKIAAPAPVEEITFNPEARHEFLTGFHKRKLQRAKHAQELAEKRAKEEKRAERRKIREERAAEFQRALEENRRQMRELNGISSNSEKEDSDAEDENAGADEDEWEGIPEPVDYEAEYIDEDKYTTVTVEELDPSKDGLRRAIGGEDESVGEKGNGNNADEGAASDAGDDGEKEGKDSGRSKKRIWTKERPEGATKNKRKKKRNFRYETKEERKLSRFKERAGNRKQAKERKARK